MIPRMAGGAVRAPFAILPLGAASETRLLLAARGLRAVGDGFVSLLLPIYLLELGYRATWASLYIWPRARCTGLRAATSDPCPAGGSRVTGQNGRRPGDPYEVGFGKPPKHTRFKKGGSGNPKGRPRKRPDLYSELTKVLCEKVTISVDGRQEKLTVQQALLRRLRDQALRGDLRAQKLALKVLAAWPESGSESGRVDMQSIGDKFDRIMAESAREKGDAAPDPVEPEDDE